MTTTANTNTPAKPSQPSNKYVKFSMKTVIPYYPASELIGYNWKSAGDVLTHLIFHPEDRHHLIHEAWRRSPGQPKDFSVLHPLLHRKLQVNSFDNDYSFLVTLHTLKEESESSPIMPPQSQSPATPPPFPTFPEVYLPSPCQITFLSTGPLFVPLFKLQPYTHKKP